jgi:lipoprotein-anchoring transpeptidase ErfK/SrfK
MSSSTITYQQAIHYSQLALNRGDKTLARNWARLAATINSKGEEAWLLMAAAACPQASVGYLKRALEINPESQRARKGMVWALKRVDSFKQTAETSPQKIQKIDSKPISSAAIASQPVMVLPQKVAESAVGKNKYLNTHNLLFSLLLFIISFITVTYWVWNTSGVQALIPDQVNLVREVNNPAWAQANIIKPTLTMVATETAMPTVTFTPTLVSTQTPEPTSTETAISSPTPLATDTSPSGTAVVPEELPNPSNQNTGSGKWILVDISEQHMYVYEGNTLVYSFIASTGMNNATRTGTFAVQSKIPNAYGSTWNIWMPDWLGIYYSGGLENGIHALPILPNGATLWEGYLGTPISYGCVVLDTYDAQVLYNWAEIGTPVIIQW